MSRSWFLRDPVQGSTYALMMKNDELTVRADSFSKSPVIEPGQHHLNVAV